MSNNEFFNETITKGQQKLANYMPRYESTIKLESNQRIKKDKKTNIFWLEEKRKWKDPDGQRHNCWVRIATINNKEG